MTGLNITPVIININGNGIGKKPLRTYTPKIAIAAISALVSLLAFCQSEEFIKVGSVKITKEDSLKFSPRFKNRIGNNYIYHGNFTSRIIAENPTKETITLETVLVLGYSYRNGLSTITTITKLPANSSTEIALPIPLAVYGPATYMKFSTKDHNNRIITKNNIPKNTFAFEVFNNVNIDYSKF